MKTCRICRGEGTPDQPLFHPCKCRGSIKYIHQDCLQFWLDHSKKDTCDICNTKFNFKVIYSDDSISKKLSFWLLLKNLFSQFMHWQNYLTKTLLFGLCVGFYLPVSIVAIDSFYDFLAGIQKFKSGVLDSILFNNKISDDLSFTEKLVILQRDTIPKGVTIAIIYGAIVLAIILIQNNLAGDPGVQKIINKRIGLEPNRQKLLLSALIEKKKHLILRRKSDIFYQLRLENELYYKSVEEDGLSAQKIAKLDLQSILELQKLLVERINKLTPNQYEKLKSICTEHPETLNEIPYDVSKHERSFIVIGVAYLDRKFRLEFMCKPPAEESLIVTEEEFKQFLKDISDATSHTANDPPNVPEPEPAPAPPPARGFNPIHNNPDVIDVDEQLRDDAIDRLLNVINGPRFLDNINEQDDRDEEEDQRPHLRDEDQPNWDQFRADVDNIDVDNINDPTARLAAQFLEAATGPAIPFAEAMAMANEDEAAAAPAPAHNANADPFANVNRVNDDIELPPLRPHEREFFRNIVNPENVRRQPRPQFRQPPQAVQDPPMPIIDEEPEPFWNGPLSIKLILTATVLVKSVTLFVLFLLKCLPYALGKQTIYTFYTILHYFFPNMSLNHQNTFQSDYKPLNLFVDFIWRNIIDTVLSTISNVTNKTLSDNLSEKISIQLLGIGTVAFSVYCIMKYLELKSSQLKPLSGNSRSLYIILLQMKNTFKVFTLMFIEWCLFPLICGILVEFALVPIFNEDLYNYHLEPRLFGFLSVIPTWFLGTFFMYFFASYVSMIRSKILRTGVLFFIRPSDDPNIQLVHDAIMRPFGLRFSRILLSLGVYAIYILCEFILVSWSIRLFSPIAILPFHSNFSYEKLAYVGLIICADFMKKPLNIYWKSIFVKCCSLLRLSSFLLNEDHANERGKIVYKSFFARFNSKSPNYNNPVAYSETKEYFSSHPDETCCFVPDGNYVRAPDDDHVARNFVRTLFVAVTKSDRLLEETPTLPDDEEKINPYGDIDPFDVNTYTIVYRPPQFKPRLFLLFACLWLASMVFTFGIYLSNIIIGKTIFKITTLESVFSLPSEYYKIDVYTLSLTMLLLSQLNFLIDIVQRQMQATNDSPEASKLISMKKIVRSMYLNIRNTVTEFFNTFAMRVIVRHTAYNFTIIIYIGLAIQPVFNPHLIEPIRIGALSMIIFTFVSLISSFLFSNAKSIKIFRYITVFTIVLRLIFITFSPAPQFTNLKPEFIEELQKLNTVEEIINLSLKNKITPDPLIIQSVGNTLLPPFLRPAIKFFMLSEFTGVEAWIYITVWFIAAAFIAVSSAIKLWSKFVELTKQIYFDNMKVLVNTEGNDDDDDE